MFVCRNSPIKINKKMSPKAHGIKNSWKYEKDLIILLNPNDIFL